MPTARPFAYNTGSVIQGAAQIGNLAVGWPTAGFGPTGLPWWNGPDEDLGYVIAKQNPSNNQNTSVGTTASIGFSRSTTKTESSFISLAQSIASTTFASGNAAKIWLNANGYWTSWPGIVTSGLVLNLDATNTSSYPGSGITWTDLSVSGYNGTLINGPTYNKALAGSIVFDGVNDRVSRNTPLDTGQNFTVSAWIYPTLLGITRRAIVGNSYNYSGRNGWLFCTAGASTNNTFFMSIGSDASYRVAAANTLSLNTWQHVTAIVTNGGGSITLLKDGQATNTASVGITTGTITYTRPQFNIGFRDFEGTADPYTGNISQVTIYNRALTSEEVQQNYNETKMFFGL